MRETFTTLLDDAAVYYLQKRARIHANERVARVVFAHDFISSHIVVRGRYESDLLAAVQSIVAEIGGEGAILDVGANLGNHTIFFSQFSDEVHSFEPHPLTYRLLALNTEGLENVFLHPYGLSNIHQVSEAGVPSGNFGGASLGQAATPDRPTVTMDLRSLDEMEIFVDSSVSIVKLDVEGHELKALEGMSATIMDHRPLVLFEQNRIDHVPDRYSASVIQWLERRGYDMFYEVSRKQSRVPQSLPRFFRTPLRILERTVSAGHRRASLTPLSQLEDRDYDLIVAGIRDKHRLERFV